MRPIMLARVAHVLAFTDVLRETGAPVGRELKRAGLPAVLGTQPDAYVPVLFALKFIRRNEYKQGIDDFGFLATRQHTISHLSKDFVAMSRSVPTLFARFRQFGELAPLENTNCRVSMHREGNAIRICNNLIGYPELEGLHYSEWIQLMVMIEIIQESVGLKWHPSEITFQSQFSPCYSALEQFPDTRFLFGQENTSIKLPVSLMTRLLRVHQSDQRTTKDLTSTELSSARPILDFPGSLKLALRSYLRERYPDINFAAEISSSSVRTLQRRLARFGLRYSDLVQQTRIEVAAEMLEDPGVTSIEVADAVGYADSSHFARAFRSIVGISPQEYRRRQKAG